MKKYILPGACMLILVILAAPIGERAPLVTNVYANYAIHIGGFIIGIAASLVIAWIIFRLLARTFPGLPDWTAIGVILVVTCVGSAATYFFSKPIKDKNYDRQLEETSTDLSRAAQHPILKQKSLTKLSKPLRQG